MISSDEIQEKSVKNGLVEKDLDIQYGIFVCLLAMGFFSYNLIRRRSPTFSSLWQKIIAMRLSFCAVINTNTSVKECGSSKFSSVWTYFLLSM